MKRGRVNPRSKKQVVKDDEWTVTRRAWLADEPYCQLHGELPSPHARCWGGVEVHHVLLRSQGGKNDGSTPLMTLCFGHHQWSHLNKTEAIKVGARVGASGRESR